LCDFGAPEPKHRLLGEEPIIHRGPVSDVMDIAHLDRGIQQGGADGIGRKWVDRLKTLACSSFCR